MQKEANDTQQQSPLGTKIEEGETHTVGTHNNHPIQKFTNTNHPQPLKPQTCWDFEPCRFSSKNTCQVETEVRTLKFDDTGMFLLAGDAQKADFVRTLEKLHLGHLLMRSSTDTFSHLFCLSDAVSNWHMVTPTDKKTTDWSYGLTPATKRDVQRKAAEPSGTEAGTKSGSIHVLEAWLLCSSHFWAGASLYNDCWGHGQQHVEIQI